jgi:hypothetical protein
MPAIHVPPFQFSGPGQPIFYRVVLSGGGFQDSSGNPLSLGWLEWRLSHDSNICILGGPSGSQIVAGIPVRIYLDQNGSAVPGQGVWPNDQLTPGNSYYTVKAFNAQGIEVWAVPQNFVLQGYTSGQTVDLGTLQPIEP